MLRRRGTRASRSLDVLGGVNVVSQTHDLAQVVEGPKMQLFIPITHTRLNGRVDHHFGDHSFVVTLRYQLNVPDTA